MEFLDKADFYADKEEYLKAIKYYDKAIKVDEKCAYAYCEKACLLALRKEDEALEILNTVINFEFCEPEIQKSIAGCLFQLGKIKESKEHFNKAEKLRKIDEHKTQVEAYSKMMKNIKILH